VANENIFDLDVLVLMHSAEQFTNATLQVSEVLGLTPFQHAVSLAVAAETAQINLRKLGAAKGATDADWAQYEQIRDSVIETLRESARVAAEKERAQ
jgi:hypothetical protein